MKKFKLSWQHFLMTMLIILVLGSLVYYLEQNKVLEGMNNNKNKSENKPKNNKHSSVENSTETSGKGKNNDISLEPTSTSSQPPSPSTTESIRHLLASKKPEGFSNLNYAPVSSSNMKASCPDPLEVYEGYKCGPLDINNFFGNIEFKPECCGNPAGSSYSNSVGCACICPEQWSYLNSRGGNRNFPTEF